MTPEQVRHAKALLTQPDASIARLLNVSRSTLYKYIPELKSGRHLLPPALTELPME
jgi:hypothetical protein